MKPLSIALGALAVSLMAGTTFAQTLSPADRTFASKTAQALEADSAMGHLATQKAGTIQVQGFASTMIQYRDEAKQDLGRIAQQEHLNLPAQPGPTQQSEVQRLRTLSGHAFDDAYVGDMIHAQQQNVADVRSEIQNGQDPELKAFAQKYLPIVQQHLQVAQDIPMR